jgi:hypothetical protein
LSTSAMPSLAVRNPGSRFCCMDRFSKYHVSVCMYYSGRVG